MTGGPCLYFNNGRASATCLIRDMSDRAARIIISHTLNIPHAVELYVTQTAETMRARVEWRTPSKSSVTIPLQNSSMVLRGGTEWQLPA